MEEPRVVAIDIGATNTRIALMQGRTTIQQDRWDTQQYAGDPNLLLARIDEWFWDLNFPQPRRLGISFAGPTNDVEGTAKLTNVAGWEDWIPVRKILDGMLDPDHAFITTIRIGNDATLGAFAEYRFGVKTPNLAYMTISTGVGGGVLLNGQLYTGPRGAAAEFGHFTVDINPRALCGCGLYGCLEAHVAGPGIANRARKAIRDEFGRGMAAYLKNRGLEPDQITAEIVAQMADANVPSARQLWEEVAEYLARGLHAIAMAYDPEVIVLGGSVTNSHHLFLELAIRLFRKGYPPKWEVPEVVLTQLGDEISLLGAQALVLEALT